MTEFLPKKGSSFTETLRPYFKWSMAAMLVLGFASGLPLMMVFSKLSFWLREAGVDRATIGGFYGVSLAYSIKFLWAPFVDRLRIPVLTAALGRRRSWMLLGVTGATLGLFIVAISNPSPDNLSLTLFGAFLLAYSGATLDIAVDAWRIESAADDEQANMAAVYIFGYRLAIMFAGVGLIIASRSSWMIAYMVMSACMAAVGGLIFLIAEPDPPESEAGSTGDETVVAASMPGGDNPLGRAVSLFAVLFLLLGPPIYSMYSGLSGWYGPAAGAGILAGGMSMVAVAFKLVSRSERPFVMEIRDAVSLPFLQIVARFGVWVLPVLLLVAIYRLSDFTMGTMASPFYADLGYDKETVGWISGIFGPWPIVVGGFLGGFAAVRFRLMPALLLGAVLTLLTNGAFAGLAIAAGPGLDLAASGDASAVVSTPPSWALLCVIGADNLAAGYVGTVFVAYLSSLTQREFAATQYALFSSAYSFYCKLMASTTSGPLAEAFGWASFYGITALFTIPSALLILLIMFRGPEHARGIIEAQDVEA